MGQAPILYLETSIFGFFTDADPRNATHREAVERLFSQIDIAVQTASTSPLTVLELDRTPEPTRSRLLGLLTPVQLLVVDDAAVEELSQAYVRDGVVPEQYADDARHVAYAVLGGAEVLVSMNLRHLANEWAERRLNVVSTRLGHRAISIRTPAEVLKYED
jgi:hypothetical protein